MALAAESHAQSNSQPVEATSQALSGQVEAMADDQPVTVNSTGKRRASEDAITEVGREADSQPAAKKAKQGE